MSYRQTFRRSRLAEWGFRLAIVSAHIVVFTVLLHRYAGQSTAVSLNLLQIGFIGALISLGMCLIAAIQIWNKLLKGFGKSVAGVIISLVVLAWPISMLPVYIVTPKIYDVSTSLKAPPKFDALKKFRSFGSNPVNFVERDSFAADVTSLRFQKTGQDTFDLVRQFVLKRKWELVSVKAPSPESGESFIEAVDRSALLAVPGDIVIRIRTNGQQSVLDMRSAARYGTYDLGRNQRRIQAFLDDIISQNSNVKRISADEPRFDSAWRTSVQQPGLQPLAPETAGEEDAGK